AVAARERQIVHCFIGDRGGQDTAPANVDPHMGRRLALLHGDDLAADLIACAEFHGKPPSAARYAANLAAAMRADFRSAPKRLSWSCRRRRFSPNCICSRYVLVYPQAMVFPAVRERPRYWAVSRLEQNGNIVQNAVRRHSPGTAR